MTFRSRTAVRGAGLVEPLAAALAIPVDHQPSVVAGRSADRDTLNRSTEMQLLHEDLARAHMEARRQEAARDRQARRLLAARRAQRRAERAGARARMLLALAHQA